MGDIVNLEDYRKRRRAQAAGQTGSRPLRPDCAPGSGQELPPEERAEDAAKGAKDPANDKPGA